MKSWTQKAAGFGSAVLVLTAVLCVANRMPEVVTKNTALAAAGFIMPGGAAKAFESDFLEEDEEDGSGSRTVSSAPGSSAGAAVSSGTGKASSAPNSENSSSDSSSGSSSAASSDESQANPSSDGKIREISIANAGTQFNNIWVRNSNQKHDIDIPGELAKAPAVKIKKDSTPQVLIYHTHTTEAYMGDTRSRDLTRSVVAVGDQIAAQLQAAGIQVVHDKTVHDYPTYNGSYDRSKVTMLNNLKKYPGIQVTLDIHRDAMGTSDGTRVKPTAVINGKKAAQLMIISGCDDDGSLGFPNWEYNLRLAVRLQQSVATMYPGLARPLNFCARKYNENLTKGSLLIEIGTEVNTLDEAKYTGEMFGKSLAATLNKLT